MLFCQGHIGDNGGPDGDYGQDDGGHGDGGHGDDRHGDGQGGAQC